MASSSGTPPRTGLRASTRRASIGANVALQIVLAGVILVMLNYLAMRHYRRFDWTADRVFTLSEQSEAVLRGLPRDVSVIVMMSRASPMFRDVQDLLARYRAVGGDRLQVRFLDPDLERAEFERTLEQYPVQGSLSEDGSLVIAQTIIVVAGERRRFLNPEDDFVRFDPSQGFGMAQGQTFNAPVAETALTSAIYGVTEGRQRVVCVTTGHGEWEVTGGMSGARDRSLGPLGDFLEHYEVELRQVTLSMDQEPDLEPCAAVLVAGPRQPFLPAEAAVLERFATERGGDLMLLLDPVVREGRFVSIGLEGVARRLGVELHEAEVVGGGPTAQFCGGGDPAAFIARGPGGRPVCIERARPVTVPEGRQGQVFLETSRDGAYGEVNATQLSRPERDDADLPGPLTIGVLVEQDNEAVRTARLESQRAEAEQELTEADRRGSRIIVVGDSDFLDPRLLQNAVLANVELAVTLIFSVAGSEVLVAMPPREVERTQLTLTDDQLRWALLIFVFGLPALAAAAGVGLWWTRRR